MITSDKVIEKSPEGSRNEWSEGYREMIRGLEKLLERVVQKFLDSPLIIEKWMIRGLSRNELSEGCREIVRELEKWWERAVEEFLDSPLIIEKWSKNQRVIVKSPEGSKNEWLEDYREMIRGLEKWSERAVQELLDSPLMIKWSPLIRLLRNHQRAREMNDPRAIEKWSEGLRNY